MNTRLPSVIGLDAPGPGTFRRIGVDNQTGMFAKWEQRFTIVKQQTGHLVSLEGATRIEWSDSACDAETVRAWVVEVPLPASANNAGERKYKILPTRLEAEGNVNFDTPRLSAKTKQIEAIFEQIPETHDMGLLRQREDAIIAGGPRSPMRTNGLNSSLRHNPSVSRPTTQVQEQQQKPQKFHITGDRIRAQVLQSGDKSTVREVAVVGNVHLRETIVDKPNALPIDIVGHTLHMVRDSQEQANIQITGLPSRRSPGVKHGGSAANGRKDTGQPARVSARGLTITAAEVNLDQASNRVWVDGGGVMTIAQQREVTNAAGNSKDPPALLGQQDQNVITWKRRMTFDGQVVRFEGDVVGRGKRDLENGQVQTFTSRSQSLLVKLNQLVDFRREKTQQEEPIDINLLQFDGGVEMDSRTFDWTRSLSAVEHIEAANLSVDYVTGRLLANGPGRLESVRRGDAGLTNRIGDRTKNNKKKPGSALSFANIHFQRAVTGNILRRHFVFQRGVEAIYGPVKSWHDRLDPNRRTGLGEDGVFLTCDKLTVLENKLPYAPKADQQQPVEMIAEGRAYARGNRFEAHGHRISIDESKHSIVLEGDAREGARILHQPYVGAPRNRLTAGKIYYSKRTGRVQWQDLTFGEVVQP
ncbi:MAG: hypothetical protein IH991_01610 [Planctomycetes bacterium]|nr:hypothetical protein [Planctomycetota bacterium]